MVSRRRIPTQDEHTRIVACNERVTPLGFKAYFYSKEGLKGAERPFRLMRSGYRDAVRYFENLEVMERYVERMVREHIRMEELSVLVKMFDIPYECATSWSGTKCGFVMRPSVKFTSMGSYTFETLREIESAAQRMIDQAQRQAESENV